MPRPVTTPPVLLLLASFAGGVALGGVALGADATPHPRARDLGVPFDGTPGPLNAITDLEGVLVGHTLSLIHI